MLESDESSIRSAVELMLGQNTEAVGLINALSSGFASRTT